MTLAGPGAAGQPREADRPEAPPLTHRRTDRGDALPLPPTGGSRGLTSNAAALVGSRLTVAALGWLGTVLIARHLGEQRFGEFTLVFSLLGMLAIVTDLGIGRVAIAGVLDPTRDQGAFAGTYVLLRATLGLIGYGAALLIVALAGYPPEVGRATAIAGLIVVLATPSHAWEVAFQAHMKMPRVAVAAMAGQAVQLALTVLIVFHRPTVVWLVVPAVVCEVVILAIKIPQAHRLVAFRYVFQPRTWRELLVEAVPLSIGSALAIVYYRVDSVMLSKLDTFESVGMYGVAYKFVDLVHYVPVSLSVPVLTILVRSWPGAIDDFRRTLVRAAAFLAHLGALVAVEIWLYAKPIVGFLYGREYAPGAWATKILLSGECLGFISILSFACLVASNRHRRYPLVTFAGLVFNVIVNLVLIPRYSYQGAAVATLVTEALVASLMWFQLLAIPGLRPLGLGFLARAAPPLALSLAVGALASSHLPWPIGAAAVAAVFVIGAHLVRSPGPAGWWSVLRDEPAEVLR